MTLNANAKALYEDINLHDWEELLGFFTGRSVAEAIQPCQEEALKQILERGEDTHPGCAYAESLCSNIASQINRKYPDIEVSWYINCQETSLNLSCDGETEKVNGIYDYLEFLNMLTGLDDLYDILEAVYNHDLFDDTESEAERLNSSKTLKLIRSVGVESTIDKLLVTDELLVDELLTSSGCSYIVDDYPQTTLTVALIVKSLIDELVEGSTTEISCSKSKFAFVIDVNLANGNEHRITCFDDMEKLMADYMAV